MRFGSELSVAEVIREIRAKIGTETAGGKDHGLFLPPNKDTLKKGKWLEKNKTLKYYGLANNSTAEYKKMHRQLRVKLVDDTSKLVIIDDSRTVREITDSIGEKIGLKTCTEYSLRKPAPPDVQHPLWLDDNKTLHDQDQDIAEDEELEFAKKLYYSDEFIDKDDPFSLHLLYVEANKAVIEGRYNITRTDAKDFAALQLQITYGDHDLEKHKPGFFDKERFIPDKYRKDSKLEKEILRDHKKLAGMKEVAAKFRYVQLVRSLKTYGVTFFDCMQIVRGKKKPVPIQVGIARDKILKVSPESGKVEKEWTWAKMRRWQCVKTKFTLDFGDSEEEYLNLETEYGETMAQLIAAYIEMILKARTDVERVIEDDDDDVAEATEMDARYGYAHTGITSSITNNYGQSASSGASMGPNGIQYPGMPASSAMNTQQFPRSNKINITDLDSAMRATQALASDLGETKANWARQAPPTTLGEEEWKKQFDTHKANIARGVAELLGQAKLGPGSLNRNNLDAKTKELAVEMKSMATGARNLAAFNDDNVPLLDGAKAVADSVADLMKLLSGALNEPHTIGFEPALEAVEKAIANSQLLLANPNVDNHVDTGTQIMMFDIIADVNNQMESLLHQVGKVSTGMKPPNDAELKALAQSFENVKDIALSSLQNLAPYALDPAVRRQILVTHAGLDALSKELVKKAASYNPRAEDAASLEAAAAALAQALGHLLASVDSAEKKVYPPEANLHSPALKLLDGLATLRSEITEPSKVLDVLTTISTVPDDLHVAVRTLGPYLSTEMDTGLSKATAMINDRMIDLMDVGRVYTKRPYDMQMREKVLALASELESQAHMILADAGTLTALNNLRHYAKVATGSVSQLATTSASLQKEITDPSVSAALIESVEKSRMAIGEILKALPTAIADDFESHSTLLAKAKNELPHFAGLTKVSSEAARLISDTEKQQGLDRAVNETAGKLQMFMQAVRDVSNLSGEADLEKALAEFDSLRAELETAEFFASQGMLSPEHGQSKEAAMHMLKDASERLGKSIDELAEASKVGDPLGQPIRQQALAMENIVSAIKPIAALNIADREAQRRLIGTAKALIDEGTQFISLSRALAADQKNPRKKKPADASRQSYKAVLGNLVDLATASTNAPPDVADVLRDLKHSLANLKPTAPPPGYNFGKASRALEGAGKALSFATEQLLNASRTAPNTIPYQSKLVGQTTIQIMELSSLAAGASSDKAIQEALLAAARDLADSLSKLIPSAALTAQKKTPAAIERMNRDAATMQEALDDLLGRVGSSAEADTSATKIMNLLVAFDTGSLEVIPGSRQDILNEFLACAKDMARVQASLLNAARSANGKVPVFSRETTNVISRMVMAAKAAQVSDGSGDLLTIDAARIVRGVEYLTKHPEDTAKALAISKQITKACTSLIAHAKMRAQQEPDAAKRQAIVRDAQKVVASASSLMTATSNASQHADINSRQSMLQAATQLSTDTYALDKSMRSKKEQDDPNIIDKETAKKLASETRALAVASIDLVRSSAALAYNSKSKELSEDLTVKSDATSASLQGVLKAVGTLNPVVRECDRAIGVIMKASTDLDTAKPPSTDKALKDIQADTITIAKQLAFDMKEILLCVDRSPVELLGALETFESTVPKLVENTLFLTALASDESSKVELIGGNRNLLEKMMEVLKAVKGASMNDPQARADLSRHSDAAAKSLGQFLQQIQSGAQLTRGLEKAANDIEESLGELRVPVKAIAYPQAREQLIANSRELASHVTTLINADKRNTGEVGLISQRIADTMPKLVLTARVCAASTSEENARSDILNVTEDLGKDLKGLIVVAMEMTEGQDKLKELLENYNSTNVDISKLLAAAQKGAVGEAMIDKSTATVRDALNIINLAEIMAGTGNLRPDDKTKKVPYSQLIPSLAQMMKVVHKRAEELRGAVKEGEKQLGDASQQLSIDVKNAVSLSVALASRTNSPQAQIEILRAAKEIAFDANEMVLAAKHCQSSADDADHRKLLSQLSNSLDNCMDKFTKNLDKSRGDTDRRQRELNDIKEELLVKMDKLPGEQSTPENLMELTRGLLSKTGEFVYAPESDKVPVSKNLSASVTKWLNAAKGASELSPDPDVQKGLIDASFNTTRAVADLMDASKLHKDDEGTQKHIEEAGAKVATSMNTFLYALKRLPNTDDIVVEEPTADLDSIAEQELLRCAKVIADAAKSLMEARPKKKGLANVSVDQEDINEAILDAARMIAEATGNLVQKAAVAQQERRHAKQTGGNRYHLDPMWANGLISAAQNVAASVTQCVKAANNAASGKAEEEALIASARGVATSTAHLLSASRAKADPSSEAQRKLGTAAKSVTDATSHLVSAAHAVAEFQDAGEEELNMGGSAVNNFRLEMEQQAKINDLEKDLERKRRELLDWRKKKYQPGGRGPAPAIPATGPPRGGAPNQAPPSVPPPSVPGKPPSRFVPPPNKNRF